MLAIPMGSVVGTFAATIVLGIIVGSGTGFVCRRVTAHRAQLRRTDYAVDILVSASMALIGAAIPFAVYYFSEGQPGPLADRVAAYFPVVTVLLPVLGVAGLHLIRVRARREPDTSMDPRSI